MSLLTALLPNALLKSVNTNVSVTSLTAAEGVKVGVSVIVGVTDLDIVGVRVIVGVTELEIVGVFVTVMVGVTD